MWYFAVIVLASEVIGMVLIILIGSRIAAFSFQISSLLQKWENYPSLTQVMPFTFMASLKH